MAVHRISDPDDPRVAEYLHLTDVALRSRSEPSTGIYLAESDKVIRRALAAGHQPVSYLMGERWVADLADLVSQAERDGTPVYVGDKAVLRTITGFHLHRGAIAAMRRPEPLDPAELIVRARRVVVLEDIVDHTNVGAIFRSAAGLGVDAVLVTPRCADPLYRRSVRVSMGTVFQIPWARIEPWPGSITMLQDAGFTVASLALSGAAVDLDELAQEPPDRLALILGTEGDGLAARTVSASDLVVRIPMSGGVDSLNVAAASAVAFWALRSG